MDIRPSMSIFQLLLLIGTAIGLPHLFVYYSVVPPMQKQQLRAQVYKGIGFLKEVAHGYPSDIIKQPTLYSTIQLPDTSCISSQQLKVCMTHNYGCN